MQDQLLKSIADDLGISSLPAEEQKQLLAELGDIALKAATLAIVEKLSPEDGEQFATLAEAGDPAKLQSFLDEKVPNHEELAKQAVQREIVQFRSALQG